MQFDWWTLALQTANFAVLVWLLHRFLYRPVLRLIDKRRAEIEKQFGEAAAAEATAKAGMAAIQAERSTIAAERDAALKSAAAQAGQITKDRLDRAKQDATAFLASARATLAAERRDALETAQRTALDLGTEIARRLLAEMPMRLRAEAWLEQIERHLASLPKNELGDLAAQARDVALVVVTAGTLPDETKQIWRDQLHAVLGDGIGTTFAVDTSLIAGAELRFENAILRFSWHSMVAAMRAEIEHHDTARR
jgi:F-type H+-transporting ATPase subunit b